MKTLCKLILISFIAASCGPKVKYLYDENDPEYVRILELKQQECVNDSAIFKALDKTSDFNKQFNEGLVYKITDKNNKIEFAKIISMDSDSMKIAVISSDNDGYVLTWTQEDNKDLLAAITNGVCSTPASYGFSSLDSTSTFTFSDKRESKFESTTVKLTESYTLDTSFPLVLHVFNGKISKETVKNEKSRKSPKTTNKSYSIEKISSKECQDLESCNFDYVDELKNFCPKIDMNHYKKTGVNDELMELQGSCNN